MQFSKKPPILYRLYVLNTDKADLIQYVPVKNAKQILNLEGKRIYFIHYNLI